jgi:enamine deaminase RidA (YjgF/YER057c/UK114 family)
MATMKPSIHNGIPASKSRKRNFRFGKPVGLLNTAGYSQVVEISKGKLILLSGQMPVDEKGELIGKGDFKTQATRAWQNIVLALKSVGLDTSDIVKLNYYVVDLRQNIPPCEKRCRPFSRQANRGPQPLP